MITRARRIIMKGRKTVHYLLPLVFALLLCFYTLHKTSHSQNLEQEVLLAEEKDKAISKNHTGTDKLLKERKEVEDVDLPPPLFAVNTNYCKLPLLDPYKRDIKKFIGHSVSSNCAKHQPLFTSFSENSLRIDRKVLLEHYHARYVTCFYEVIHRANDTAVYFDPPKAFDKDHTLVTDFVRVSCPSLPGNKTYRFYHTNVPRRLEARFGMFEDLGTAPQHYNVLILGVDSISRSNMVRQLSKTRNYLLKELKAFEMLGYNKIGDNTLPNLFTFLTGRNLNDVFDLKPGRRQVFDYAPFIWRNYAQSGYRTLFAEDDPNHGCFNLLQKGFEEPPTDYYYRPYAVALEAERALWWTRDCVGPETEVGLVLDYTKKFVTEFRYDKYFSFSYLSRLTHDNPNRAHSMDDQLKNFLQEIKEGKKLEKTVVIFMSDHGSRYGSLRGTDTGSAEERLPALYLSFPDKFLADHPVYGNNLNINQNRLTTPSDVYQTLKDILALDDSTMGETNVGPKQRPSFSLLKEVCASRDCTTADISRQWCMCRKVEELSTDMPLVLKGTEHAVFHMNSLLSSYPELCSELKLDSIEKAHFILAGVLNQASNIKTYMVTFIANPGQGKFEATLNYDVNTKMYDVIGMVSRIDSYKGKSDCINDKSLRLYCHCKQMDK